MLNFAGCAACGQRSDFLDELKRTRTEEDDDETYEESIEFEHCCKSCNHLVAKHSYDFRIVQQGQVQEFSMSCALCGKGEDVSSSLPVEQVREQAHIDIVLEMPPSIVVFPSILASRLPIIPQPSEKNDNDDDDWN